MAPSDSPAEISDDSPAQMLLTSKRARQLRRDEVSSRFHERHETRSLSVVLPGYSYGISSRTERHASVDRGTTFELRSD
jgi:hypothetical protein